MRVTAAKVISDRTARVRVGSRSLRSRDATPSDNTRPRHLMAYLGWCPASTPPARPTGGARSRKPAIRTRAGAAWHYRHRPTVGRALASRSQAQPDEVVKHAWQAQQRLRRRDRHLVGHGKRPPVAVAAIARELVGFLWAAMTRRETRTHVA